MIMNALVADKITAEPSWAGLHRTGLLKKVQKILSALLAHHLRRAEAELMALDDRMWTTQERPSPCERSAGSVV
jgi:hypothetical protein